MNQRITGTFTRRNEATQESRPDSITPVHHVMDRVALRGSATSQFHDIRGQDLLCAHTLWAFGAVGYAIAEHPGFEYRIEQDWIHQFPVVGLRWRWNDSDGEHTGYIEAKARRSENLCEFTVFRDDKQIGNSVNWPFSSLNSDVTIQVSAILLDRVYPISESTNLASKNVQA